MGHRAFWAGLALGGLIALAGCAPPQEDAAQVNAAPQPVAKPNLEVQAKAISDHEVEFTVITNIPTPIQVMAEVGLADQKPDDIWIGYQKKVTLTGPSTTFVLDTSQAGEPLPNATYEAEVSFYPRWGAEGNEAAKRFPDMEDMQLVDLRGAGGTRDAAVRKEELQKWVMLNVDMNTPWNEAAYISKLGKYRKSKAELSPLHDAYYFPDTDMTLIVNRVKGEVTIWRMGRQTK